jgi:hypothetical protein
MITVVTGGNNFIHWLKTWDKVEYITRKWGKWYRDVQEWYGLNEEWAYILHNWKRIMIGYDKIVSYTLA